MNDENCGITNLIDFPLQIYNLEHWTGSGQLSWRNGRTWDGDFALVRLLNGRLRFNFKLHDELSAGSIKSLIDLKFSGKTENGSIIEVEGIHFTHVFDMEINVGYASKASLQTEVGLGPVTVRCDLTNFNLGRISQPVNLSIGGFDISLGRIGWGRNERSVEQHAIAYRHASISAYLMIEDISPSKIEQALDCLSNVAALLRIACRSQVSSVVVRVSNRQPGNQTILLEEPPFTHPRWARPLIPANEIDAFLEAACHATEDRIRKAELAYITDHYLQALATGSAWPMALGIFTAMDTLRSAFFRRADSEEARSHLYWVVPSEKFQSEKKMIDAVIGILTQYFPRFGDIVTNERDSLRSQIGGLNRRSYKTQLKWMLEVLGVEYIPQDLHFFINTRNQLVHEGTPVPPHTTLEDYPDKVESAWKDAKKAIDLFERSLLAFLGYKDVFETFSQGMSDSV